MGKHEFITSQHSTLTGDLGAPRAARSFVRTAIVNWTRGALPAEISDRLTHDAMLLVSELVTNAVVHAGTTVELCCRLEVGDTEGKEFKSLVVEVSDHHPARPLLPGDGNTSASHGRGLQLVAAIAESWGINYRSGLKTVWFRLPTRVPGNLGLPVPRPRVEQLRQQELPAVDLARVPNPSAEYDPDPKWVSRGTLAFLAEASDLLAGQFDEDKVAALAGQLLVPRLADWCAVWLEAKGDRTKRSAPRLARVWHANESLVAGLRAELEKAPPSLWQEAPAWPVSLPWSIAEPAPSMVRQPDKADGTALACRLVAGRRRVGTLILGRAGLTRIPDEVTALVGDFARRLALALVAAQQYTHHANTSRVLQQALLPSRLAAIPGVDSHVVYEPAGESTTAGGDFYDLFRTSDGRWCFALGDVCGHGPEAAVVTGLVRPLLKVLAEEGYGVTKILNRLNQVLIDDRTLAAEAAEGRHPPAASREVRLLSLLYGELVPNPPGEGSGIRCTLASAGHPLPLLLCPDGQVYPTAEPQLLLGVMEHTAYECQTFEFEPGHTLLCVTDGVTERRCGQRQFDDEGGLEQTLSQCVGLSAAGVAEQVRRAVHEFTTDPPDDDLAMLVLQAR